MQAWQVQVESKIHTLSASSAMGVRATCSPPYNSNKPLVKRLIPCELRSHGFWGLETPNSIHFMIDVELNGCATSVTRLDRVRNGLLESPEERSDPELLVVAEDDDKKFETENTGSALRMFESGDWERHRLQQCSMMNSSEEQRMMEEKEEETRKIAKSIGCSTTDYRGCCSRFDCC